MRTPINDENDDENSNDRNANINERLNLLHLNLLFIPSAAMRVDDAIPAEDRANDRTRAFQNLGLVQVLLCIFCTFSQNVSWD